MTKTSGVLSTGSDRAGEDRTIPRSVAKFSALDPNIPSGFC
ncbi:hypothetical protein [Geitlerinema sp. PCC 9228]|nr:hypothetical protein [Geitlerinema sp. PCC 9228]